ncbi:hypothetical protein [Rhodococcus sp. UNC363MFTsu5.1]|nr:hypothetical protein [Rhodococcus sp. UNC363MFTsu5.1]
MNARAYWAWLRAYVISTPMLLSYAIGGGMFGAPLYFAAGGR